MPYVNKPRPYKKEYQQQLARGEHERRMERQRARRSIDKKGKDVDHDGKVCSFRPQGFLGREVAHPGPRLPHLAAQVRVQSRCPARDRMLSAKLPQPR